MDSILKPSLPVGLACDHAGYHTKQIIIRWLEEQKISYKDFGCFSENSCDYADYAHPLANAVEKQECYPGLAVCGSGNGINMTLNKHQGIRSALCWDVEIAGLARLHNDANICVLPGRFVNDDLAIEIIKKFLATQFEGGRHQKRIDKIPIR